MKFAFLLRHSIKTRVTLFTLAIFLTSIWLLSFYVSQILQKDMQTLLGDQQFSVATMAAKDINDEMTYRFDALNKAALLLAPFMADSAALQTTLLQQTILEVLFNAGVVVIGTDGNCNADLPLSSGRIGVNYANDPWIVAALKEGKTAISPPMPGKILKVPLFAMTVPIRTPQGRVIGALAGVVDLGKPNFLESISFGHYGKDGNFLLISKPYRRIIASSDKRRIMEQLPAAGVDALIDRRMSGQQGTEVFFNPRGIQVLSSSVVVPVADWNVIVSLPTEEAFSPIRDVERRLLMATLMLTSLTGLLSWWMVRRQLAPILATVKTLSTLSQSNQHPQSLPITRGDEIGELIGGFNHLLSELGKKDAFLNQILDTSSVAIFLLDPGGCIMQANRRTADLFDCSVTALNGHEFASWINPPDREDTKQKVADLLSNAVDSLEMDQRYWRSNGNCFWGHLSGRRFLDAYARVQGVLCVIADITDRKLAEQQLIEHHDMLGAIIENFPGGVSMFDANLRLTAHNQRFRQLLDFPDALFDNPDLNYQDLIRFNAQRGEYGPCDVEQYVAASVARALHFEPHRYERVRPNGMVLEIYGQSVPGGFETIYLDITERKKIEEQVHQLAFYDPLTRLPNRRMLEDRLNQTMALSKRSGRYAAAMILDLDNFKPLNDQHGHLVGDLLLIEVARRLTACVREVDTVARFGGDEFVVILGELDQDKDESAAQARLIAEKIRHCLAAAYVLNVAHEGVPDVTVQHQCSVSIGAVLFINHEASQDDILKWADAAMYQAKDGGRNSIRFYEPNRP